MPIGKARRDAESQQRGLCSERDGENEKERKTKREKEDCQIETGGRQKDTEAQRHRKREREREHVCPFFLNYLCSGRSRPASVAAHVRHNGCDFPSYDMRSHVYQRLPHSSPCRSERERKEQTTKRRTQTEEKEERDRNRGRGKCQQCLSPHCVSRSLNYLS